MCQPRFEPWAMGNGHWAMATGQYLYLSDLSISGLTSLASFLAVNHLTKLSKTNNQTDTHLVYDSFYCDEIIVIQGLSERMQKQFLYDGDFIKLLRVRFNVIYFTNLIFNLKLY